MRRPWGFITWCALVLLVFATVKQFGLDPWPFAAGLYAVAAPRTSSSSSSSSGSSGFGSSGGRSGSSSSSHK